MSGAMHSAFGIGAPAPIIEELPTLELELERRAGGRAIDRHEPAICRTFDLVDDGAPFLEAVRTVSAHYAITPDRLEHLCRVWAAVGGLTDHYGL
jgi:hypothetical protein